MDFKFKIKDNGKPLLHIVDNRGSGTLDFTSDNAFHYKARNMFISECNTRRPRSILRKFIISIRLDGHFNNTGQHRMSQMNFDEQELLQLRNQIDNMLGCIE